MVRVQEFRIIGLRFEFRVLDSIFRVQVKKNSKLCVNDMDKIIEMSLNKWKETKNNMLRMIHKINFL